ncbi:hypothetical protein [Domibacillus enclensis]|uniref:Uncharacterized protein n=1 Tax=Domibacillus enclensis TaxID=1017273 RepID=A0A1N6NU64_9BACI|nr:hypothetical protein [Domibacillus enclensis]OXS80146.1 hypothetical protein B1B05_01310 [Domibacillus enclensis]SIP95665.1 hypothetical protein SAMN05443094_101276 [Domibacillus enclensis]
MNSTTNQNEIVLHPTEEQRQAHYAECRAKGWTVVEDKDSIEAKMFDKDVEIEGLYQLIDDYVTSTGQQKEFSDYLIQQHEEDLQRDWRYKKWALDLEGINSDYEDEGIDKTDLLRGWIDELIGDTTHCQAIPLTNGKEIKIVWAGKSDHDEHIFKVNVGCGLNNPETTYPELLDQLSCFDIDYVKMAENDNEPDY